MKSPRLVAGAEMAVTEARLSPAALGDPEVQAALKQILATELECQRQMTGLGHVKLWWVSLSQARCDGCGGFLCRCYVGGSPHSPYYVCPSCGLVMTFRDLANRDDDTMQRASRLATAIGQPQG